MVAWLSPRPGDPSQITLHQGHIGTLHRHVCAGQVLDRIPVEDATTRVQLIVGVKQVPPHDRRSSDE
jgi:hypothetical protein